MPRIGFVGSLSHARADTLAQRGIALVVTTEAGDRSTWGRAHVEVVSRQTLRAVPGGLLVATGATAEAAARQALRQPCRTLVVAVPRSGWADRGTSWKQLERECRGASRELVCVSLDARSAPCGIDVWPGGVLAPADLTRRYDPDRPGESGKRAMWPPTPPPATKAKTASTASSTAPEVGVTAEPSETTVVVDGQAVANASTASRRSKRKTSKRKTSKRKTDD